MYQLFLLILSGATVCLIMNIYQVAVIHDIFYYIFIFIGYYGYKYGFKALNEIYYSLRGKQKQLTSKKLSRRKLKPTRLN